MTYAPAAPYYDAIYTHGSRRKNYPAEADVVDRLIQAHGKAPGRRLLEVAIGTGLHAARFVELGYRVQGLDLCQELLAVAQRRLPGIPLHLGDMTDFNLGETFSAVTCLFSAIGHVTTLEGLHQTIQCKADHLDPGGILVIEPWIKPDEWLPGHIGVDTVDEPGLQITRTSRTYREGSLSHMILNYKVVTPAATQRFEEHHVLRMTTVDEYLEAFRAAKLAAMFLPAGINNNRRGVYVATKHL